MLASKKQEWHYEEPVVQATVVAQPMPATLPQAPSLNIGLRAKCMGVTLLIAVMAVFFTMQSEAIIRAGYNLVQLKTQTAKLEKENELLRLEIARLKSPQRIQQIATKELGMVVPQNIYCAVADKSTTLPETAKEKSAVDQVVAFFNKGNTDAGKR